MKQTIEIEVPDGKKAIWKDGTIVFENIKPKLPKTWEEFCEQNKVKIQVTEQHLPLIQLHQLRDCYRQGWTPTLDKVSFGIVRSVEGDLGMGKSEIARTVIQTLRGADTVVPSPTFTIVQVYEEGRMPFYHFDVYRIGDIEEMEEIGYDDYFFGEGICLIEWANLIEEILPDQIIAITIEKDLNKGFDYRKITVEGIEAL